MKDIKVIEDEFKEVEPQHFEGNTEEVQQEFVESLKQCENEIIGSEKVGSSIEFYDEDGAVLILVDIDDETVMANFEFTLSGKTFKMPLSSIPDSLATA